MEVAKLKNGAEETKAFVDRTMMSLQALMQINPAAFYELVMKCRDTKHELLGNVSEVLESLCLIQDRRGSVHDTIRNIVLSAAEGDGFDLTLDSPFAEKAK